MNHVFLAPSPASGPTLIILSVIFFIALLAMVWVASAIRVVPEYQRLVVFRLGRYLGTRGPGLVLLIPSLDRGIKVDFREQEHLISSQGILTGDKYPVTVERVGITRSAIPWPACWKLATLKRPPRIKLLPVYASSSAD